MDSAIFLFTMSCALILAPFFRSVINRTKAFVAGRQGPPWLQPYRELRKLFLKDAKYSKTTTWLFRAGPIVALATTFVALLLLPQAGAGSPFSFAGDVLFFVYALALGRMFMLLAAMDTGSSFEAMGASREAQFSALAEPVLLLSLVALARGTADYSLSHIFSDGASWVWAYSPATLFLSMIALTVVALTETSRIPIDDPTTHLELTMIHEVMVLDHSGPDLGFIEYTQALKLWIFSQLVVNLALTVFALPAMVTLVVYVLGTFLMAICIGLIESMMARIHFLRVPRLIFGAAVIASLSVLIEVA